MLRASLSSPLGTGGSSTLVENHTGSHQSGDVWVVFHVKHVFLSPSPAFVVFHVKQR
jgi:hypothetical protein